MIEMLYIVIERHIKKSSQGGGQRDSNCVSFNITYYCRDVYHILTTSQKGDITLKIKSYKTPIIPYNLFGNVLT